MIQAPYHKVQKWAVKRFKVVCMIYYVNGRSEAVMSKERGI
jgi:hypothetical protein